MADATQTEIQDDIGERRDENPLAYDDNKLVFDLTESDLKKIRWIILLSFEDDWLNQWAKMFKLIYRVL